MNSNASYFEGKLLSDEKIIELYWDRDEQAIRETDLKYGRYLLTIAYNLLNDRQDSEECQNDTYLGTWNAIPPSRPSFFQAFLTKILRRTAVDRYKQRSRQKRIPCELTVSLDEFGDSLTDGETPEDALAASELGRVISEFLRTLPERRRLLFVFRYYYADPVELIAGMFGISQRMVYSELAELREQLKKRLTEEGYEI